MQLLLPSRLIQRLQSELKRAGTREIGGLLMGEHVGDEVFRIVDISVQRSGGSRACFIRRPEDHKKALKRFFARTGNDFTRFNYLGEWHSHPTFLPSPSSTDVATMRSLVADPSVGSNFLILLIAKHDAAGNFQATATAFAAGSSPRYVALEHEPSSLEDRGSLLRRLGRRMLGV